MVTSESDRPVISTKSCGITGMTMPNPIVSISMVRKMNVRACLLGPRDITHPINTVDARLKRYPSLALSATFFSTVGLGSA
jgi:hypothetical protein